MKKSGKNSEERRKLIHAADIVFLCLPDMAAIDAVALAEGSKARIIDASPHTGRQPDGRMVWQSFRMHIARQFRNRTA